jgi:malate/lactate dehydrogenase
MKAAIIGYSGQIGEILTQTLADSINCETLYLIGRKKPSCESKKIEFIKTDFSESSIDKIKLEQLTSLFICIGTTKKKTPKKDEYFFVDYSIPVRVAEQLKKYNCKNVFVV